MVVSDIGPELFRRKDLFGFCVADLDLFEGVSARPRYENIDHQLGQVGAPVEGGGVT